MSFESYTDQILDFVKDSPVPSFLVAKDLQIPIQQVNQCLDSLACEGRMKAFDLHLLGKKERLYYTE